MTVLARSAETSFKTLQALNPELRQSATPKDSYELKIPKGTKDTFLKNYNALPENERFAPQSITHKVRNGESLWTIAKKYRVSQHDIAAVNKMPSSSKAHLIRDFIAGGLGVVLVSYIANHVEPSLAGFVAGMPIGLCLIYFVAGYKESLNYTVAHSLSMIILCLDIVYYTTRYNGISTW